MTANKSWFRCRYERRKRLQVLLLNCHYRSKKKRQCGNFMITKIFQIKVCPTFTSLTAPSCKWLYVDLGFGDPVCKEEEAAKLFNRLFQFLNAIWVATNSLHKNIVVSSDNCSSQQQQPVATQGICLTGTVAI